MDVRRHLASSVLARSVLVALLAMSLAAVPAPSEASSRGFSDVPAGSTFANDIAWLAQQGITKGCGSGRFCPDRAVTRAEMAAFLSRALGLRTTSNVRFRDVPAGHTFVRDVDLLATAGITKGCGSGRFCPDRAVTRAEMAAFLRRAIGGAAKPSTPSAPPSSGGSSGGSGGDDAHSGSGSGGGSQGSSSISHGSQLAASMTGITSGVSLTSSGAITTSSHGQVIEGRDITVSGGAAITVRHDDVVIRNNRIRHGNGANGVVIQSSATGTLVEHNHLDGRGQVLGNHGSIGVTGGSRATIRRNYFTGGRLAGSAFRSNTTVVENWVNDLVIANGSHGNGFSFHGGGSGIHFLRNRTVASNSGGLTFYASNGAVQASSIRDNLVIGTGSGFAIYGGRTHSHYGSNRDIRIEGNRFQGTFGYPGVLGDSTNAGVDLGRPGNTFANNRWVNSTSDLPARCGVSRDACE